MPRVDLLYGHPLITPFFW